MLPKKASGSNCQMQMLLAKHASETGLTNEDGRGDVNSKVERQTVDLSAFPDLVVIYLGMRVNAWTGLKTLLGMGPKIKDSVDQKPDGLLLHENFIMSLFPLRLGMRQYWRDFEALEAWSRSPPHREWWLNFLRSSRGTGFWHETYFMRGGMEAVYDDIPIRLGFGQFAPLGPARGPMFSAGPEPRLAGDPRPAVIQEAEYYRDDRP
jgi:hypothetical protein